MTLFWVFVCGMLVGASFGLVAGFALGAFDEQADARRLHHKDRVRKWAEHKG